MAKSSGMETADIIKYAAIGAAIWFGYRWAVSQGMIPDYIGIAGDVVPQLPAGNGAGNGNGSTEPSGSTGGSEPGSNTAPGGSGGAGGSIKDQVWEAAKAEANNSGGMLHFWGWNYYLPADKPKIDPFSVPATLWPGGEKPVDAPQVQATPLTIDQWWSMVKGPMGLSGAPQYQQGGINHWSQQASIYYGGEDDGSGSESMLGRF